MIKNKKTFLITGAAGFIGSEIAKRLIINGENVIGIDNLNSYYDVNLKKSRLFEIEKCKNKFSGEWFFHQISIENQDHLEKICEKYSFDVVIHLAAQAGVRFSITNPEDYVKANLVGFFNILELCRKNKINNFIFASSSSVYGGNKKVPFNESHNVDHPVSFYAATKKSNEVMAHSYSHLFNIPTTGLRFFTVYGPWGRPDMAPMIFAKSILKKETIKIFNYGDMIRDFTYIDDITETICRCSYKPATKLEDSIKEEMPFSSSLAPYRVFNVGNNNPVKLINFINLLENYLGCKAIKNFEEIKQGDVKITYSDSSRIKDWINFAPQTKIEDGVGKFANWFKSFYGLN